MKLGKMLIEAERASDDELAYDVHALFKQEGNIVRSQGPCIQLGVTD